MVGSENKFIILYFTLLPWIDPERQGRCDLFKIFFIHEQQKTLGGLIRSENGFAELNPLRAGKTNATEYRNPHAIMAIIMARVRTSFFLINMISAAMVLTARTSAGPT